MSSVYLRDFGKAIPVSVCSVCNLGIAVKIKGENEVLHCTCSHIKCLLGVKYLLFSFICL